MPKANLYNMAGKQIGEVELSEAVFGIEPNQYVVHDVVKNHLANCRQGTQSSLTRAEVSGGGKKPWRQKGTGHARQGSTRAPQWTHGGIVFVITGTRNEKTGLCFPYLQERSNLWMKRRKAPRPIRFIWTDISAKNRSTEKPR